MNVIKWEPNLAGNPTCPILQLTADLECPFCHHVHEVQSGLAAIGGEVTLEKAVQEVSDAIRAQRSCARCGIISCLPIAGSKKFEQEVTTTITAAWLEEKKKALEPF